MRSESGDDDDDDDDDDNELVRERWDDSDRNMTVTHDCNKLTDYKVCAVTCWASWQARKCHCRVSRRSVPRPADVATSVVLQPVAQIVFAAAMETGPHYCSINRSYFSALYSSLLSLTSRLLFQTERHVVEAAAAAADDDDGDDDETLLCGHRQLGVRF